nr:Glycoside hydrolase domain containing protein [Haemonchus contortus]
MAETLRVARNYSRHLPIYVYTKFEYDPLNQLCSFYTKEDLCSTIVLPYKMGADGLIFWSSSSNMTKRCDIVTKFVNTTLGPLVKKVLNESAEDRRTAYNLTSHLNYSEVCDTYVAMIANFTDDRCNTTTLTPITARNTSFAYDPSAVSELAPLLEDTDTQD